MLKCDYHIHSHHSFDAEPTVLAMAKAAEAAGLDEICFADHLEFPCPTWDGAFDPQELREEIDAAQRQTSVRLLCGAEIGLSPDPAFSRRAWEHIKKANPDFIIGSVHISGTEWVHKAPFYAARTRQQAYTEYLAVIDASIRNLPELSVLGHYNFIAKYAPYTPREVSYTDAPEHFDSIFRWLAENGKGLEVNTGVWKDEPAWGLDALKRFRELGGEFVTFGSDAHKSENMGRRLDEARELARVAGIRYTAVFRGLKPELMPL